jgi:hypothetical protein
MSFRPPRVFAHLPDPNRADTALNAEILGEKALALGRAGKRVEQTLAQLRESADKDRENARRAAAEAVYAYLIQRELCGLRDSEAVFRSYGVPRDVIAILGAR